MKIVFTDLYWKNQKDNTYTIKSVTLEGMENGIITIESACRTSKSFYRNLRFCGDHYELISYHPNDFRVLDIAIFEKELDIRDMYPYKPECSKTVLRICKK